VNFLSDNSAAVAPVVLDAIAKANDGFAPGYGDDEWTRSVERHLSEIFEREVAASWCRLEQLQSRCDGDGRRSAFPFVDHRFCDHVPYV